MGYVGIRLFSWRRGGIQKKLIKIKKVYHQIFPSRYPQCIAILLLRNKTYTYKNRIFPLYYMGFFRFYFTLFLGGFWIRFTLYLEFFILCYLKYHYTYQNRIFPLCYMGFSHFCFTLYLEFFILIVFRLKMGGKLL